MRADLSELLSLRRGHFLLASGLHGDLVVDRSRIVAHPSRVAPLAKEPAASLTEVDVVCGPEPGGALLARLVAAELDAMYCPAEQLTESTYRIAGDVDLDAKTVAVVDDVYDTGRAVYGTREALELLGARPVAVGALVVLQAPRGRGTPCPWTRSMWNIGLSPARLAVADESVWLPDECPRCAFGVPLDE